ncbi:MAG: T9SS type A sorting domain-containing protein, partial [Saprospiraceae bacterium]|nr:T9SS type A sorting domain-containing protein [Saprospiraceae bacterium]
TPVEAASGYVVQISRLPNFPGNLTQEYLVLDASNTLVFDLENNRTYYWRVRAFNSGYFCTTFSSAITFKTAEVSPAENLEASLQLKIYPNPLSSERAILRLELTESDLRAFTQVQLFDLSGKQIWQTDLTALPAFFDHYELKLPLALPSGLYFLRVASDLGPQIKKLVID